MTGRPEPTTILVVDDSAATLEVLRRNLEGTGYHVLTAPAVDEAELVSNVV